MLTLTFSISSVGSLPTRYGIKSISHLPVESVNVNHFPNLNSMKGNTLDFVDFRFNFIQIEFLFIGKSLSSLITNNTKEENFLPEV